MEEVNERIKLVRIKIGIRDFRKTVEKDFWKNRPFCLPYFSWFEMAGNDFRE